MGNINSRTDDRINICLIFASDCDYLGVVLVPNIRHFVAGELKRAGLIDI